MVGPLQRKSVDEVKVYLTGSLDRRDELRRYADQLVSLGVTVTSRWLWADDRPSSAAEAREIAMRNVNDLLSSNVVFVFVDPSVRSQGGHHFEHGFAYGMHVLGMCRVELVGEPENVFHQVDGVKRHDTWGAAIGSLVVPGEV